MRTGTVLKREIWIWPIIAVIVLSTLGYTVSRSIRMTMKASFRSELQTLLNVETSMLVTWMQVQSAGAETQANNRQIREAVEKLVIDSEGIESDKANTQSSVLLNQLSKDLSPGMVSHGFDNFFVADRQMKILAASSSETLGLTVAEYESFLTRALDGVTTVSTPFPSVSLLKDEFGRLRSGVPTMFVCAPIRDS